jgi:hypothetical protein
MQTQNFNQRLNQSHNRALGRNFSGKHTSTVSGRSPYNAYPRTRDNKSSMVMRAIGLLTLLVGTLVGRH